MTVSNVAERPNTLYAVQVLRGIAAILVVLFHASQFCRDYYHATPLNGLFLFGFAGVHLFFVLSGFIILTIHYADIGQPRRLYAYLVKRFVRIYPLYWVTLALLSAWLLIQQRVTLNVVYDSIALITMPVQYVNPVAWTLSFELLFYILFASAILHRRFGGMVLLAGVVTIIAVNFMDVTMPFPLRHVGHKYIVLFLFGLITAFVVQQWRERTVLSRQRFAAAGLIIGGVLFAATAYWCVMRDVRDYDVWWVTIGFGIASACLLLSVLSPRLEQWCQSRRLLIQLGDASYSIYLVHYVVMQELFTWLYRLLPTISAAWVTVLFAVIVSGIGLIGWLLHRWLERPLLQWLRQRLLPRRA